MSAETENKAARLVQPRAIAHQPLASVRAVLSHEELYKDGPPQWLEGRSKRRCRTAAEAQRERHKATKRLRRFGRDNPQALALAARLDNCIQQSRCGSGACPECGRAFQRWLVGANSGFLRGHAAGSTILSLVPCGGIAAPGKLGVAAAVASKQFSRFAIASVGIEVAFGALDLSYNEERQGGFAPHWSPHLRVHFPGQLSKDAEAELRALFGRCPCHGIARPVQMASFDGNLAGLAYTFKPEVGRRQSYRQVKGIAKGGRECRNTRGRPLTGEQAVEAAIFLHRLGLAGRLLVHGGLYRVHDRAFVVGLRR